MMASTELPGHLRVARVVEPSCHDVLVEVLRPGVAAFEVTVPVDVLTQRDRARAEQIKALSQDLVRLPPQALRRWKEWLRHITGRGHVEGRQSKLCRCAWRGDQVLIVLP